MPAVSASAPGKVILFGEHAVVYGQPAIAVPVEQVAARAAAQADIRAPGGRVWLQAEAIGLDAALDSLPEDDPIRRAVEITLEELGIKRPTALKLRISSSIPVAAGLGSGAAVSVAVIRALSEFLGHPLDDARVSALAFEVEKLHHGTPSGIDNTVVTFAQPVFFVKGNPIETFKIGHPLNLVIADTGIASPTRGAVEDVRRGWEAEPERYEGIFEAIGRISREARGAIESGNVEELGRLMDANHSHLQELDVSSVQLDELVEAARGAGAWGAKLSGGGRGGNMIALAKEENAEHIAAALTMASATNTIVTTAQ